MLDALPLPRHPNVEQYKKQAKELLKACKSSDPQALPAWVTQWLAVQLGIDPALANVRRAYTAGEIAHRVRHGVERVYLSSDGAVSADVLRSGFFWT